MGIGYATAHVIAKKLQRYAFYRKKSSTKYYNGVWDNGGFSPSSSTAGDDKRLPPSIEPPGLHVGVSKASESV
jgi:hypothetical protein